MAGFALQRGVATWHLRGRNDSGHRARPHRHDMLWRLRRAACEDGIRSTSVGGPARSPTPKSREAAFFYVHPQNRFWCVLAAMFDEPVPEDNADRSGAAADANIGNPVATICRAFWKRRRCAGCSARVRRRGAHRDCGGCQRLESRGAALAESGQRGHRGRQRQACRPVAEGIPGAPGVMPAEVARPQLKGRREGNSHLCGKRHNGGDGWAAGVPLLGPSIGSLRRRFIEELTSAEPAARRCRRRHPGLRSEVVHRRRTGGDGALRAIGAGHRVRLHDSVKAPIDG